MPDLANRKQSVLGQYDLASRARQHRTGQTRTVGVVADESPCAVVDRVAQQLVGLLASDQQHRRRRAAGPDVGRQPGSVEARHLEFEQHDVRLEYTNRVDDIAGVADLADYLDLRLGAGEQSDETRADHRPMIDHEHPPQRLGPRLMPDEIAVVRQPGPHQRPPPAVGLDLEIGAELVRPRHDAVEAEPFARTYLEILDVESRTRRPRSR